MPLLHWYCSSFLKQIFNCYADFTTDFGNGNIISEACPITKLNTSTLKSALTILKTFCYQINLHQATMTAIMIMPGSVTAYNVNPWNSIQARVPRKDERNSPANGTSRPISNTTCTLKKHNGGKRDPTTTDTNEDNPSGRQRQKKPHCGVKVDTAAKEKKDLGMFYLRNVSINPGDIFPRVQTSLARETSVTTLIVTLLTPGRLWNSNARQSLQLLIISSRKTWVGSTNITSRGCPTSQIVSKTFLVTLRVLPVRWLDLSDSCIATLQIHWITKTLLDCIPTSLTSRRGPSLSTKSGLSTLRGSCIF
jgi:hypothetical protein